MEDVSIDRKRESDNDFMFYLFYMNRKKINVFSELIIKRSLYIYISKYINMLAFCQFINNVRRKI